MCDILKYGCKLPFLCTTSNPEFNKIYLVFKNSEFGFESIKEMLRADTIKESLTKGKKRLWS